MSATPLNALRVFETVARTGSFRAAADALFVTQSAVSHQIRHLEDWCGTPLFDREGNRTQILPHAQDLARALSLSLAEIDAACNRLRAGRHTQPLVIAAIPSVAMCWLIPHLDEFRKACPSIETRVIYAMHGRDIDFREVHIAFVFSDTPPRLPGVEAFSLFPGFSVPVCSPTLVSPTVAANLSPTEICNIGLLHDSDTAGWADWLASAGTRIETPISGAIFEDFNLLRTAALSGQGVALCPAAMISPDIDAGRLVQLSDRSVLKDHTYYMLIGPLVRGSMAAEGGQFRDWALTVRDAQPEQV